MTTPEQLANTVHQPALAATLAARLTDIAPVISLMTPEQVAAKLATALTYTAIDRATLATLLHTLIKEEGPNTMLVEEHSVVADLTAQFITKYFYAVQTLDIDD